MRSAYVSALQTAFPFTSVLSSYSTSRLFISFIYFLTVTHRTCLISFMRQQFFVFFCCKTVLRAHIFFIHVLPTHYLKEFPGKEANLSK